MVQRPLKSKQLWITAQALGKKTWKTKPGCDGYLLLLEGPSPQQLLSPQVASASLPLAPTAAGLSVQRRTEQNLTKAILLLCLQHTSSTKRLQANLPFQKQVLVFNNNTLLQQQASQIPATTSSSPYYILTPKFANTLIFTHLLQLLSPS